MNDRHARVGIFRIAVGVLFVLGTATPLFAGPELVNVFVTNRVSRAITNLIEIRMPLNRFVDEYRTNWIEQFRTNVIDVYRTNWLKETLTNTVVVERKQTNVMTLTATNWQTVLVVRTNWVTQPVTNVAEINLPANQAVVAAAPVNKEPQAEAAPRPPAVDQAKDLVVEVTKTPKPANNNLMEVQFTLKSANDPGTVLEAQEWRVERSDGTVLVCGQRPQFETELPPGTYNVSVKTGRGENTPSLTVRATVEITREKARQRTPVMILSAAK